MVDKMQFLSDLNEALALEEVQILPLFHQIIKKLRASSLDDSIIIEVEEKLWRIHVETVDHAKMLTELMKTVIESDQDEF